MASETTQAGKKLKMPPVAAIAGIIFSLLFMASLIIIRLSIPADLNKPGELLADPALTYRILIALNMVPFTGIAFLWFIGVVRDRIGELEDKFFATVFLGSGLLFVAMLFTAAAVAGGLLANLSFSSSGQPITGTFSFGRAMIYEILNVFAMKMAGVFMISTCTIAIRTESIPRWLGVLGYVFAAALLLSITYMEWIALLFPLWVLALSAYILVENYHSSRQK